MGGGSRPPPLGPFRERSVKIVEKWTNSGSVGPGVRVGGPRRSRVRSATIMVKWTKNGFVVTGVRTANPYGGWTKRGSLGCEDHPKTAPDIRLMGKRPNNRVLGANTPIGQQNDGKGTFIRFVGVGVGVGGLSRWSRSPPRGVRTRFTADSLRKRGGSRIVPLASFLKDKVDPN